MWTNFECDVSFHTASCTFCSIIYMPDMFFLALSPSLSLFLSHYRSLCVSVSLCVCLCFCLSLSLTFFSVSVPLSLSVSLCLCVCVSFCLCLSVCLSLFHVCMQACTRTSTHAYTHKWYIQYHMYWYPSFKKKNAMPAQFVTTSLVTKHVVVTKHATTEPMALVL